MAGSAAGGAGAAVWWLRGQGIGPGVPEEARAVFPVFWQAWRIVQEHYVDPSAVQPTALTYGAIRGMLDALGDEGHTRFLSPEELKLEEESLQGEFEGIGAEIALDDGRPTIVAPYDGSPAERAGLRAGDVLLAVDGQSVEKLSLDALVLRVRGPKGTTVHLTVLRPSTGSVREYAIERERIEVPLVTWAMTPSPGIAHLRLTDFSEGAADDVRRAIGAAQAQGARAFVIDVRDNPGGLLDQAIAVTSQFVGEGNILLEQARGGKQTPYPARQGGVALDVPIVVLVNRGSASSAEIFAGAIQDHGRGAVIGERTFGTGTVLETYKLQDGSAILLGTAQWLTPNGHLIKGQGITPDIVVPLPRFGEQLTPSDPSRYTPEGFAGSTDDQLKRAVEHLAGVLAAR